MGSNFGFQRITNYLEYVHVHLVSVEVGIIRGCDLVVMVVRFGVFSIYGRIGYMCNELPGDSTGTNDREECGSDAP